ncbi:MAG: hypothetical protein CR982_00625 [Candidatus Cloacimonadota bacterium]|nr:MAG: hypothetical protein CR982_00625 [Candidatus Cloacimonadota bacterium]PIE78435.1 MAG: hypothetical protein CSA15_07800 [Candidatus Delongbacteria bacterium]
MKRVVLMFFSLLIILKSEPIANSSGTLQISLSDGYSKLYLDDYPTERGTKGAPALPYKEYNYIIPNNMKISNFTYSFVDSVVYEGISNPFPEQFKTTFIGEVNSFVEPDQRFYSGVYPLDRAEVVEYGYIAGFQKVATIRINCVRWDSNNNSLIHYRNISFDYDLVPDSKDLASPRNIMFRKDVETYKAYVKSSVVNWSSYQHMFDSIEIIDRPINDDYYNYLIIVADDFYGNPYLEKFIEWKRAKGNFVKVIKNSEIPNDFDDIGGDDHTISNSQCGIYGEQNTTGNQGVNKAPSLRKFLRNKFENYGLSYLLVVGDEFNSPVMFGNWANDKTYGWVGNIAYRKYYPLVSDHYFADLNSDWNKDGAEEVAIGIKENGVIDSLYFSLFGEPSDDPIDKFSDIFVGRVIVPTENPEYLENWVEKTITYEKNPGLGDISYLNNVYIAQSNDLSNTSTEIPDFLNENGTYNLKHDIGLRGEEFTSHYNGHNPAIQFIDAHGAKQVSSLLRFVYNSGQNEQIRNYGVWNLDKQDMDLPMPPTASWCLMPEYSNGLDNLSNFNRKYSVLFSASCRTAAFWDNYYLISGDFSTNKRDMPSMAEVFVGYSKEMGGPIYIGDCGQGLVHNAHKQLYLGLKGILSDNFDNTTLDRNSGVLLAIGKNKGGGYLDHMSASVYGDPELNLWVKNIPNITKVIKTGENQYLIGNGSEVYFNAQITTKNSSGYNTSFITNGVFSIPSDCEEFTILMDNYLPKTFKLIRENYTISESNLLDYSIVVDNGAKLTIADGVELQFTENQSIIIGKNGSLVGGTNSVLKNSDYSDNWGGIYVNEEKGENLISSIKVENAVTGIEVNNSKITIKSVEFYNTIGSTTDNIFAKNSTLNISNSYFHRGSTGIKAINCRGSINNSTIKNNTYGIISILSDFKLKKNYIGESAKRALVISGRGSVVDMSTRDISNTNISNNKLVNSELPNVLIEDFGSLNIYNGKNDIEINSRDGILVSEAIEKYITNNVRPIVAPNNYWGSFNGNTTPQSYWFKPTSTTNGWINYSNYSTIPYWSWSGKNNGRNSNINQFNEAFITIKDLISEENYAEAVVNLEALINSSHGTIFWDFSIALLFNIYSDSLNNIAQFIVKLNSIDPIDIYEEKILNEFKFKANLKLKNISGCEDILTEMSLNDSTDIEKIYTDIDKYLYNEINPQRKNNTSPSLVSLIDKLFETDLEKELGNGEDNMPKNLSLFQNYPNPFNPTTTISFTIPTDSDVELQVYNTKGEMIKHLLNSSMKKGNHSIKFDGSSLSSGVYYYTLIVGNEKCVRKMMLIK